VEHQIKLIGAKYLYYEFCQIRLRAFVGVEKVYFVKAFSGKQIGDFEGLSE